MADDPVVTPARGPTPETERFRALDVLRGVAVLGIFAMNIQEMSMPLAAYFNPAAFAELVPDDALNRSVYGLVHVLFDMKMMALFSMLFGAGVVMYARRAHDDPALQARARARWFVRCGWLLIFGLVHAYFIWHGDILVLYALCGLLFLWWARRLPALALLTLGVIGVGIATALFTALGAVIAAIDDPAWAERLGMTAADVERAREDMRDMLPTPEYARSVVDTFRAGWPVVQQERTATALDTQLGFIPFFGLWHAGGLMLIGVALTKLRVLTGERSARFYLALAAAGYAVGLPLVLTGLAMNLSRDFDPAWLFLGGMRFNQLGCVPMALGHAGLILWFVRSGAATRVIDALAAAGRMAFTNYIAQSVIGTLIFYGYGLGMFGRLDRLEQQGVVAAVWAAQLAWSPWWLRRFRFGPLEWVWRSLTYGRVLPISRPA